MLERKIYRYLQEWKNSKQGECLLIDGARQVGKTFIVHRVMGEKCGKMNSEKYTFPQGLIHIRLINKNIRSEGLTSLL